MMNCEQVEPSNIAAPPVSIHVMLVDDDATSLAVVSGLLKTLNYEVTSFNDSIRALYELRAGKQSFDIVITDTYMPNMDGFELTRRVNDEFQLPVIMISTDDRESVAFRAMQEGVVLYLLKPFTLNDLRNIWQFSISTKLRFNPNPNLFIRSHGVEFPALEAYSSASSLNKGRRRKKKYSKGKEENEEKSDDIWELTTIPKKQKVVWTDFLQYRFLQAVHYIGLEKAVPKKILQVMNVPGLTRENVASHLQKYRIFLRKVAERCLITSNNTAEEVLWSKVLSRHASFVLEKIQQNAAFKSTQGAGRTPHVTSARNPNIPPFSGDQEALTNISGGGGHHSTYGPSSFLLNIPPYGVGHTASFMGGTDPMQMNQNEGQVFNFGAPETQPRNPDDSMFQNLPLFEDPYLTSSFPGNNNHSGFSVGAGAELPVAQRGVSNGCENGFGFANGMADGNYMGFEAMGIQNSGFLPGSEAIQTGEYGEFGLGFGGDNSYNWGFMGNNGVNSGGNSLNHSSHALNNMVGGQADSAAFVPLFPMGSFLDNPNPNQLQQGSGAFMVDGSQQLYNMSAAEEATPTADPFSMDDQVLDEFLASLLRSDSSAEG